MAWQRWALPTLLAGTAALYCWGLSAQGWANPYYAAAVQAGSRSWKAFFFGSLDAGNFITVDKPPFSLWAMELSARLFGFSGWSMLLPNAMAGVATVTLLSATVRRWSGRHAGLVAAVVLALSPVAVVMFRYNNPDAMLTLLLVAAGYATVRAVECARLRWLLLGAALVGTAFLTKYLEAYLVVPALAATYLVAAPARMWVRLAHLLAAGATLVVASGWWLAAVTLTPAAARPYVGGSGSSNSVWRLAVGIVGIDRLTGGNGPGVGPGGRPGGGPVFAGQPGLLRMFNAQIGGQVSWLLPAAGLALLAGVWATRHRPRTDRLRAGLLLWGLWTVIDVAVFSLMGGVMHPYYVVALAPGIAALVGMGWARLWEAPAKPWSAGAAGLAVVLTGGLAYALLARSPGWVPWLRAAVLAGSIAVALGLVALACSRRSPGFGGRAVIALSATGLALALAGPAAYAGQAVTTPRSGGDPLAGPSTPRTGPGAAFGPGPPIGGPAAAPDGRRARRGGPGEPIAAPALTTYLTTHAGHTTWIAATSTATSAAGLQLATGRPVMALGGFTGSDTAISLAGFQALVRVGRVRYLVAEAGPVGPGGMGGIRAPCGVSGGRRAGCGSATWEIVTWATQVGRAVNYGGSRPALYDLSAVSAASLR